MPVTKRVLIADDDEELAAALAQRCRLLGIEVETAGDGRTAIAKVESFAPHLAILDVNMPFGNGLGVCEMLARDETLRKMPIIVMTGRSDAETIRRCHDLLAYYVQKCTHVWSRIAPLIVDLLGLERLDASPVARLGAPERDGSMRLDGEQAAPAQPHPRAMAEMNAAAPASESVDHGEPAHDSAPMAGSTGVVLCIDDNPEVAQWLKLRLDPLGVEMVHARDGMEGYRLAFSQDVQAIVLDYEMPSGNGDYVLRRLRENPVTRDVPVIVLTGHNDRALARKFYNMGARCYLIKPVAWERLWAELTPCLHMEAAV